MRNKWTPMPRDWAKAEIFYKVNTCVLEGTKTPARRTNLRRLGEWIRLLELHTLYDAMVPDAFF